MQEDDRKPCIAVDTNLVIGGMISPAGIGKKLLTAYEENGFSWVSTDEAFEEIAEVLSREDIQGRYRISAEDIRSLLTQLTDTAEFVQPMPLARLPIHSRDPDDDFLLSCALGGPLRLPS